MFRHLVCQTANGVEKAMKTEAREKSLAFILTASFTQHRILKRDIAP